MKLTATSDAAKAYLPQITNPKTGELRASKPKDGNAAYIWRMVAFSLSSNPQHQCMPMTADFGVQVPETWQRQAPSDWLAAKVASINTPADRDFINRNGGDAEAYFLSYWGKYERRKHYIKTVLDPIHTEIVDSVPVTRQPGTMRWGRAFGMIG